MAITAPATLLSVPEGISLPLVAHPEASLAQAPLSVAPVGGNLGSSSDMTSEMKERARLAEEKATKEAAVQERLNKRGAIVAAILRRFLITFAAARQAEMDSARAEAAAKAARKGKGRKKAKKAAPEKPAGKDAGKNKKPKKLPMAEAWSGLITGLDEKVNKDKRVGLEDVYRGVSQLAQPEQAYLGQVCAAANKKVLPTEGMNLNQINLKEVLMAAIAAVDYNKDRAEVASSTLGLVKLHDRGASAQQVLQHGFKQSDLLRIGYSTPEVVGASTSITPKSMGFSVSEILEHAPSCVQQQLEGYRGVSRLRAAGYSATDQLAAGLDAPYDLRQAGYDLQSLADAGLTALELRAGGFGDKARQPLSYLGGTVQALQQAQDLPMYFDGSSNPFWQSMMPPTVVASKDNKPVGRPLSANRQAAGAAMQAQGSTRSVAATDTESLIGFSSIRSRA